MKKLADSLREEQAKLMAYWHDARQGTATPRRSSINPGALRSVLSGLSILEAGAASQHRFRLAGSHLCEVFGRELRGSQSSVLPGDASPWTVGIEEALETGLPTRGIEFSGSVIAHAWVRMPLVCDVTGDDLILGLDRYPTGQAVFGSEAIAA